MEIHNVSKKVHVQDVLLHTRILKNSSYIKVGDVRQKLKIYFVVY